MIEKETEREGKKVRVEMPRSNVCYSVNSVDVTVNGNKHSINVHYMHYTCLIYE